MPRTARKKSKTGIYHIMLRGVNKQRIFEDEEDCEKFLQTLEFYKAESGYKIYAYCLMGNHIHLLIKEGEDFGIAMRRIGASFVYWYNWKYQRSGHLFEDRYKSEVIENDGYLLTALRYIHQNPIKAGMVKCVGDYEWSSYSEYVDKEKMVDVDFILNLFDANREKAIDAFKTYNNEVDNSKCIDVVESKRLTDEEVTEIIKEKCGVVRCSEVAILDKKRRYACLELLKEYELTSRQISRLTGVCRSVVLKA